MHPVFTRVHLLFWLFN